MSKKPLIPADEKIDWPSECFLSPTSSRWRLFLRVHWSDVILCISLYWIRMFFITAGYHRYFSHRSYIVFLAYRQFLMALGATTSAQRGLCGGPAIISHQYVIPPVPNTSTHPRRVFSGAMGWILCDKYHNTDLTQIPDFAKYPELRWLNKAAFGAAYRVGLVDSDFWGMERFSDRLLPLGPFSFGIAPSSSTRSPTSLAAVRTTDTSRNSSFSP
ncbi:MAG: hypothetical protein U1F57_11855 [bacterium]